MMTIFVTGTLIVKLVKANPSVYGGRTEPPENAEPPTITFFSPNNESALTRNSIFLTFNVTAQEDYGAMLTDIWFVSDWQEGNTSIYQLDWGTPENIGRNSISSFSYNETLTEIPEGNHSIEVFATSRGTYAVGYYGYDFVMTASSPVTFTFSTDKEPEPFPAMMVIAPVALTTAVSVSLLVYFTHVKRSKRSN